MTDVAPEQVLDNAWYDLPTNPDGRTGKRPLSHATVLYMPEPANVHPLVKQLTAA